jgi:hypothetical protein
MQEIRVCPACDYGRGFHVFFRDDGAGVVVGLICPNCGQSYDLGWRATELAPLALQEGSVFNTQE